MAISSFTDEERLAIKQRLWDGEKQIDVAISVGMSPHTVKGIMSGLNWTTVPWPDGTIGPMPDDRRRHIARVRFGRTGEKTVHYKESKQMAEVDRRQHENTLDRRRAIRLLAQNGEQEPTEERIAWMIAEANKADRLSDERVAIIQEEEYQERMRKAAEEQAAYEKWCAENPPTAEEIAEEERLSAIRRIDRLWNDGVARNELHYEHLLQLTDAQIDEYMTARLESGGAMAEKLAVKIKQFKKERSAIEQHIREQANETTQGSSNTAEDQSRPGHADK